MLLRLESRSSVGVSHQTAYMGDCSLHVFNLMKVVDEFSLNEMRTLGQSKILKYGRWKLGTKVCRIASGA